MKEIVAELTTKCRKLESGEKDLERLLNEQSGLMKALNVRKLICFFTAIILDSATSLLYEEIAQ